MLTISGYASKSVLTIGSGCRRFFNFCKAGRWCRCYIVPGVHRHIRALRIAALTGAHKHTRRPRRRRRSTVFTRSFPFGKASHQGLEIWAKGFPTLVRMGSLEERECISSKEGSRHNYLKVTLEKWQKAMNNFWGQSKFQVFGWRTTHDEVQQNWRLIWVNRRTW